MKEALLPASSLQPETASYLACLATILELPIEQLPSQVPAGDPTRSVTVSRWLGGLGVGLVQVAAPRDFSWAGPWIARVVPPTSGAARFVVMYGVPSGLVWDPSGPAAFDPGWISDGYLLAAADIALAMPNPAIAPVSTGVVESIWTIEEKGKPAHQVASARAVPGWGLAGDRYAERRGTFSSGTPGSALTLIEAEVCESFDPPLAAVEHRRNIVTRGIDLNALVGSDFTIGDIRCRGMRLCEPCSVVQKYAERPVLRQLVHRAGLRVDILSEGVLEAGQAIAVVR